MVSGFQWMLTFQAEYVYFRAMKMRIPTSLSSISSDFSATVILRQMPRAAFPLLPWKGWKQ